MQSVERLRHAAISLPSHSRTWCLALLCLLGFTPALGEQQETPARADASALTLRLHVVEVLLYCTATDSHGALVTDLTREDFRVFEDKRPVPIAYFSKQDVPVSLALVLDQSGSMKDKRGAVATAALELVRASNQEDETSVTNFADTAYRDADLTADIGQLQHALDQSKTISGGTALFDSLLSSADYLSKHARHSRQVIVVVTDGNDNASVADLSVAIRRVQQSNGPEIYTIGLLYDVPGAQASRARKELQSLADQTGGLSFFPPSLAEVATIALEVARDIRNQYTVAFHPLRDTAGGTYHTISVQARHAGTSGLRVRTRAGFTRAAVVE